MQRTSYPRTWLALTLGLLLATGLFNWVVDPYAIFQTIEIPGFNAAKPRMRRNLRTVKAFAVRRLRPEGLILGSSRAEIGLSPTHPGWALGDGVVYNLAVPGGGPREAFRLYQHAQHMHPVRRVVYGADFFTFNVHYRAIEGQLDEGALAVADDGTVRSRWFLLREGLLPAVFSLKATQTAFDTVRKQDDTHAARYTPLGCSLGNRLGRRLQRNGYEVMFRDIGNTFRDTLYRPRGPKVPFALTGSDGAGGPVPMDYFRRCVRQAHADHVDFHVVMQPMHAHLCEVIAGIDLWPVFEDWKRALVQILEEEGARAGAPPFPLWDFTGYNAITTEAVPAAADEPAEMWGYWDPSHHRVNVGDLVLNRVLGPADATGPPRLEFGCRVTPDNVEEHLAEIRATRARYAAMQVASAAAIRQGSDRGSTVPTR